jgi:HlyD family secretion protein
MNVRPHHKRIVLLSGFAAGGLSALIYYRTPPAGPVPLIGLVHETELHVASELNGRIDTVLVAAGQQVHKGDVLATLAIPELDASIQEARAAAQQARADRANVEAGVRKEEIDTSAQNVQIGQANATLAQQQFTRTDVLAAKEFASKQDLDEKTATLRKAQANLDRYQAIYQQDMSGPTREERASARAKVLLAETSTAELEARAEKAKLTAPTNGTVSIVVGRPGEIVSPGESVMTLQSGHARWFTFTVREDRLGAIAVGATVRLKTASSTNIQGTVTELRPLGEFATWRAARAVGDHDLNSFLVRIDPLTQGDGLEPGMTVWLEP